jgi:sorting nexin-29
MHQLKIKIWTTETIPEDWNWNIICLVHKKETWQYAQISLLCVAYKIFSNILFNRLVPYVKTTIGDYQCGYHQERSTIDEIFTVCQILEKFSEHLKIHITSLLTLKRHMTV